VRPWGRLAHELPKDEPLYHLERGGEQGEVDWDRWPDNRPPDLPRGMVREVTMDLIKARRLAAIARRERASLVSTFLHKSHAVALMAKAFFHWELGVLVNMHEQPGVHVEKHFSGSRARLMNLFYRYALRGADGVVAVADSVGRELVERYRLPGSLVEVIENPVDARMLRARAGKVVPPADLPEGSGPLLLGLGRLEVIKGFDLLIEALARLKASSPARLVLVGDGSQRQKLAERVAALGLGRSVALVGYRADVIPYLTAADLLIVPSRTEAWPNVITEALALGTPVLAARCSEGVADLLGEGRFGFLVEPENPDALADGIQRLLAQPDVMRELGDRGRDRVERFHPDEVIRRYESALLAVAHSREEPPLPSRGI
jgi:glycosyltransferase involved in cell wall biosynthesis